MVQLLEIYARREKDKISKIIDSNFKDRKVNKEMVNERKDLYKFILKINGDFEENKPIIYRDMVDTIEDIIISIYLDDIIVRRIKKIYEGKNIENEQEIIEKIKREIRDSYTYIEEKIEMRENLSDYLRENDLIDVEGYIRFRLSDYLYIIDTAVDSIVSDLIEEEKVEEFLNIVQHFVDKQASKIDYLNVILRGNSFKLKDIDNKTFGTDIIERVKKEFSNDMISSSDILISSLIIISPKRVVVHSKDRENDLVRAIEDIFRGKFVFCSGCNICELDKK